MKKVYGIRSGSYYDGNEVEKDLFLTREDAMAEIHKRVNEANYKAITDNKKKNMFVESSETHFNDSHYNFLELVEFNLPS